MTVEPEKRKRLPNYTAFVSAVQVSWGMEATGEEFCRSNSLVRLSPRPVAWMTCPGWLIPTSEQFMINETAEVPLSFGAMRYFYRPKNKTALPIAGFHWQGGTAGMDCSFTSCSGHFYNGELGRASPVSARDDPLARSLTVDAGALRRQTPLAATSSSFLKKTTLESKSGPIRSCGCCWLHHVQDSSTVCKLQTPV